MLPNSVEENSPSPVTNVEPASNERDNTTESSPPATTADTNPPVENTTTGATEGDGAGNDTEATANPENATNQPDGTQAGAPPTYEESANHLTLEYGGYFLPYDSRPMTSAVLSPAASVLSPVTPSLSLSRMNPPRRTRSLQEAQHNDLRSHHSDITPIGRRSRRVGDVTPSDRVQTQTVTTTGEQEELSTHDKCTKLLLPPMHICMATTCLVFNCVLPGSGKVFKCKRLYVENIRYCESKVQRWLGLVIKLYFKGDGVRVGYSYEIDETQNVINQILEFEFSFLILNKKKIKLLSTWTFCQIQTRS